MTAPNTSNVKYTLAQGQVGQRGRRRRKKEARLNKEQERERVMMKDNSTMSM
jgi:hypothetical protein